MAFGLLARRFKDGWTHSPQEGRPQERNHYDEAHISSDVQCGGAERECACIFKVMVCSANLFRQRNEIFHLCFYLKPFSFLSVLKSSSTVWGGRASGGG